MCVLFGDVLLRVEHQDHDVGFRDRLQRLHHRELLDRLEHLAAAADTGRVDQGVLLAVALKRDLDRVAGGARHVEGDHALFAHQGVDQGRLAHVRAAHQGDLDAAFLRQQFFLVGRTRSKRLVQRLGHQVVHAVAMGAGDRIRIAQAQFVEVRYGSGVAHAFGLVHHQQHRTAGFAQEIGNRLVVRGHALAAIDQEHDDVGFGHGLLGLQGHLEHDAFLGDRFETAGIDDQERTIADAALAVVTIARQAREVRHQRIARAGQSIE